MRPISDYLTLKPIKAEESGGIYMPDDSKLRQGEVVRVSATAEDVNAGDVVVYNPMHTEKVGDGLLVMRESQVMALVA